MMGCRRAGGRERFGFTMAGVRRDYYSHPVEDAIVLWREHLDSGDSQGSR